MNVRTVRTDVSLIDLHFILEQSSQWLAAHDQPDAMGQMPCRLVGTKPQIALKLEGADALLAAGHQVKSLDPSCQRQVGIFKNCADRDRELLLAVAAAQQAGPNRRALHPIDIDTAAVAAGRAMGPQKLFKMLPRLILRQIEDVLSLLRSEDSYFLRSHARILAVDTVLSSG